MNCKRCGKELMSELENQGLCYECLYLKKDARICSKCGEELPLSEFYKEKGKWDGYKNQCKECLRLLRDEKEDREYRRKKDESLARYQGRAYRKKSNWMPKIGKYYRYREYFKQPLDNDIIFKITSLKEKGDSCIFRFKQIKPRKDEEIEWVVSKKDFHWTWKYEEIDD